MSKDQDTLKIEATIKLLNAISKLAGVAKVFCVSMAEVHKLPDSDTLEQISKEIETLTNKIQNFVDNHHGDSVIRTQSKDYTRRFLDAADRKRIMTFIESLDEKTKKKHEDVMDSIKTNSKCHQELLLNLSNYLSDWEKNYISKNDR